MTPEAITRFVENEKVAADKQMKIDLKNRNSIFGMVVRGKDYDDLKRKNFWRIVTGVNLASWEKTGNVEFAKIYSGTEFNRITVVSADVVH